MGAAGGRQQRTQIQLASTQEAHKVALRAGVNVQCYALPRWHSNGDEAGGKRRLGPLGVRA